jgi:LacI family transcriptional regulator
LIGLVVSDITNPAFPEIARAVEDEARRQGFLSILCTVDEKLPSTDEYIHILVDHGVDGLVVASAKPEDRYLVELRDRGTPVVLVNRKHPAFEDSFVVSDNQTGAALATHHLIRLGHERIAHIAGPPWVSVSAERARGYLDAIQEVGLDFVRLVQVENFSPEAGRQAVDEAMKGRRRPTAILAANDYSALGVLQGLLERDLRVPDDVAVFGYDDTWVASLPSVNLSTVSSRHEEMGRLGAGLVIELIRRGASSGAPVILDPELRIRGTCGAGHR